MKECYQWKNLARSTIVQDLHDVEHGVPGLLRHARVGNNVDIDGDEPQAEHDEAEAHHGHELGQLRIGALLPRAGELRVRKIHDDAIVEDEDALQDEKW